MKRALMLLILSLTIASSSTHADSPHAGAFRVPPRTDSSGTSAPEKDSGIDLEACVAQAGEYYTFNLFEGRNKALETQYRGNGAGPLHGGEVTELDMAGADLFGPPIAQAGGWVHLAGIGSLDAEALRLRVDMAGLGPDDEVWVIDPEGPRALGPCRLGDATRDERWLPATQGERVILMVRSSSPETPALRLTGFSHIFLTLKQVNDALPCNIDVNCETNQDIRDLASGTGIILVTTATESWFCSGTLINNERTPNPEPFFATANHCICTQAQAEATEVYWDYRTSECDHNDPPNMRSLPRSRGMALLATNHTLDSTLIVLDTVPAGDYGRTYLGWDAAALDTGADVLVLHYPEATYNRISKGNIVAVDQAFGRRQHQTEVHWHDGVTEQGSSGSALLLASNRRIVGMLSQGPTHSCGEDRSGNLDWFASFREFYPAVAKYLDTAPPSTELGADDCAPEPLCPFGLAYAAHPNLVNDFREVRDKFLKPAPGGDTLIRLYYQAAPALARAVEKYPWMRNTFIVLTGPFAHLADTTIP